MEASGTDIDETVTVRTDRAPGLADALDKAAADGLTHLVLDGTDPADGFAPSLRKAEPPHQTRKGTPPGAVQTHQMQICSVLLGGDVLPDECAVTQMIHFWPGRASGSQTSRLAGVMSDASMLVAVPALAIQVE